MDSTHLSRRQLLQWAGSGTLALGTLGWFSSTANADPAQLASRIEKADTKHPLIPAIEKAYTSLEKLQAVKDYTALFTKEEKIGRSLAKSQMELKLRENPFSVYLKFRSPSAGREVMFVEGRNKNMLQAHDVGLRGLAGTISLDPTGAMAMEGNRHPATMIGMRKMVETAIENWLDEMPLKGVQVNVFENSRLGDVACTLVESSYQQSQQGIHFQMTRLYIEHETGFPVKVQQYEFAARNSGAPVLVEDYTYAQIKANVGLTDADFDTKNKAYNF